MIEIVKDNKSKCWWVYKTDKEGFHTSLALTEKEMKNLSIMLNKLTEKF